MSRLPPPSASLKRCPVEPPPSSSRRRDKPPCSTSIDRVMKTPSIIRSRSDPLPTSKVQVLPLATCRLAELPDAKRLRQEAAPDMPSHSHYNCKHLETSSTAVEERIDPEIKGDGQKLDNEKIEGKNQNDRKHPETSSTAVVDRLDPAIRGDGQKLDNEKMEGKNQNDLKTPSRSAHCKNINIIRRLFDEEMRELKKDKQLEEIKKLKACVWLLEMEGADMDEMMEFRSLLELAERQYAENDAQSAKEGSSASHEGLNRDRLEKMTPSRSAHRKKLKRLFRSKATEEVWKMKKEKQLEEIKKLKACVWLLEMEGADMAEIMEFKSLLELAEKQYAVNEVQWFKLAMEGLDAEQVQT